ncbi:MAG: hypothetical protein HY902_12400 [Deltaproteobacteria bacterium]|nr:hypothetical protein [Deltaproteobacteria bacterium]
MPADNSRKTATGATKLLPWLLLALVACGTAPQGNPSFASSGGGYDFPELGTLTKSDAAGSKDLGSSGKDQASPGPDAATGGEDSGEPSDPDAESADAADTGEPDAEPGEDAAEDTGEDPGEDAGEPEDAQDAGEPEEDAELEDTAPLKDAKADNGEDPNNPWYNNPIPDEYTLPDLPDAGGASGDTNGQVMPPLCAPKTASLSVTETAGPGGKLDIVIWIDTSGSMSQEAAWVNQNVVSFMNYIAKKNIDYRVVMFGNGLGLCGSGCPVNDPAHFLWVKVTVGSTNGPNLIQTQSNFDKYKAFLRPDATHNIVAITDDNCYLQPANFITTYKGLLKNAGLNDKFVYHSIVSFANAANPSQSGNCPGGASYGSFHVAVSQATGGSMFQVCKQDWTTMFDELAKSVAATAKPVCTYKIPAGPSVAYTPSAVKILHIENGTAVALPNICGPEACAGAPSGWFYDNPKKPSTVTLCPEKCKALVGGALAFNFGCAMSNPPPVSDAGSTDTASPDTAGGDAGDVKVGSCDVP